MPDDMIFSIVPLYSRPYSRRSPEFSDTAAGHRTAILPRRRRSCERSRDRHAEVRKELRAAQHAATVSRSSRLAMEPRSSS